MIDFQLVTVTPKTAETFLSRNVGNRKPNQSTIDGYARDMESGHWRLTHQAIAFDAGGNLIDGQHRLMAVVKSGTAMRTYVARYSSKEEISKLPVDLQARRKTDFILGCDTRDQETARTLLKMHLSRRKANPTTSEIDRILSLRSDVIRSVTECVTKTTKYRTCSHARAAIVLRCFEFPEWAEEILSQYKRFTMLQSIDTMWTSAMSLLRFFDGSKALDHTEVFKRVWLAFNPTRHDARLSRISDHAAMNGEIKLLLGKFIDEEVFE